MARNKWQGLERLKRKLDRMRKAAGPSVDAGLRKAGEIVTVEQKRLAPVDRGDMRDSIDHTVTTSKRTGNRAVRIVASDPAAHLVEFGAKPHRIEPRTAEALSVGKGEFAEGVDHPGITAQPFFFPGYRATRRKARAAIAKGVRDEIVKAAK